MKKTLLTLALATCTIASFAQGRISIANDAGRLFELGTQVQSEGLVTDPSGPILNQVYVEGRSIVLALYAGTTSGAMTLQTSYPVTGANFFVAGRTATKPLTLTGVAGGAPRFFNIILTDTGATLPTSIDGAAYLRNQDANSLQLANLNSIAGATYYGSSGLFQFTPSTSAISAPAINGTGTTWVTGSMYINSVVPEPSSMALAGLGAASLLIFRRRK